MEKEESHAERGRRLTGRDIAAIEEALRRGKSVEVRINREGEVTVYEVRKNKV